MNAMQIMDPTGHTSIKWDPESESDVEIARKTFEEMKAKGYSGFAVRRNGDPGKRMADFDPTADQVILIPQLVGG